MLACVRARRARSYCGDLQSLIGGGGFLRNRQQHGNLFHLVKSIIGKRVLCRVSGERLATINPAHLACKWENLVSHSDNHHNMKIKIKMDERQYSLGRAYSILRTKEA